MTAFQKSQLTLYGLQRIAHAHVGERMVFTSIGLGEEALTGNLNEVTDLPREKQRFPIAGSQVSGNNFWASCKPIEIDDPVGIYVRTIGLYIADPEHENERSRDKLYAVTSIIPDFGEGDNYITYIPKNPGNAEINYEFRMNTIISSTALVEIVGGIGSVGIATDSSLGLVRSSNEPFAVGVNRGTGIMTVNGLENFIALENFIKQTLFENRIIGKNVPMAFQPSPLYLAKWRLLPRQYQIIEIALYQELCDFKWVGAENNNTADWWYKCDDDGTRNVDGLYMRVDDGRGMFERGAGANAIKRGANNAPYDGMNVGDHIGDAMRNFPGHFQIRDLTGGSTIVTGFTGPFHLTDAVTEATVIPFQSPNKPRQQINFDPSLVVPVSYENRPASISSFNCITY